MTRPPFKVGDRLPELCLTSIRNQPIVIPDAEVSFVHLQFRRYAGCPICNLHLRSFAKRVADLERAGIREVVVFHSSVAAMLPYQGDLPFDAVADPEKRLYRQFGVESSPKALLNPAVWPAILKGIVSVKPTRVREGGGTGLPADFLIGPDGTIIAMKYGQHANDHWSVDDVLMVAKASGSFTF